MATHSSVLAWRIPGTGDPAIYGVTQSQTQLKRLSSSSSSSSEKQAESLLKIHMEEGLKGGLQPGPPSPAAISVPISLPLHHPGDQVPVSSQGHRGKWQAQGKGPAGSPGSLPPACVPYREGDPRWSKFPSGLLAQLRPEWPVTAPCSLGRR